MCGCVMELPAKSESITPPWDLPPLPQVHYRLSVPGKGVIGLPSELGGLPLSLTLSELGYADGSSLSVVGTSPHESQWPAYEVRVGVAAAACVVPLDLGLLGVDGL